MQMQAITFTTKLNIAADTGGHSAMIHTISCYKVNNIIVRSQTAPNTGRKPGTGCAHSKIARVARVLFVLYVVGRAY